MNWVQRLIVVACAIGLAVLCLRPPWQRVTHGPQGLLGQRPLSHAWINQGVQMDIEAYYTSAAVDWNRFGLEAGAILALGTGGVVLSRRWRATKPSS